MTDCTYEYFTVFADSIDTTTWVDGNQSQFTTYLIRDLRDIVEISIVNCSFDIGSNEVIYIKADEFVSQFGLTGVNNNRQHSPTTKAKLDGSITRIPGVASGRNVFNQFDFDTTVRFINPIRRLDRITTRLYDQDGNLVISSGTNFITYRLKSKSENLCV